MKITGTIKFNSGYVDITDPCYKNGTWCRLRAELPIGEYDYEANIKDLLAWGNRVTSICIQRKEKDWVGTLKRKCIGYIGVDAGLAGFFDSKPDYDYDAWDKVCDFIFAQHNKVYEAHLDNAMRCEGVFSSSGYGDGDYPVYQITSDYSDAIVGYEIEFIEGR